jgi:hypothetical protein
MGLVESLRPGARNLTKESLLKTLDLNLFTKCDTQFRNKLKAAVNALGNAITTPQVGDASTSAKSTPAGAGKSNT